MRCITLAPLIMGLLLSGCDEQREAMEWDFRNSQEVANTNWRPKAGEESILRQGKFGITVHLPEGRMLEVDASLYRLRINRRVPNTVLYHINYGQLMTPDEAAAQVLYLIDKLGLEARCKEELTQWHQSVRNGDKEGDLNIIGRIGATQRGISIHIMGHGRSRQLAISG